ncbi:MAG: DUF763 domain-containing protein [Nitrospirae bacterium]|nr:DUF763 domain-containing protein [Nitrospirota bacterium]
MPKTGIATLPLHYGKAPKWLFERMVSLSREIIYAIVSEFGQKAFLQKLADPYWFQALGCVLGFDWHSSGLTTTVTGALKEGLRGMEDDLRVFIAGGKGKTSRKTPEQIRIYSERFLINPEPLIYASRMSAKVDNIAVQDGYQLYHHVFIFTGNGEWSVIQQGLNENKRTARRYHWLGNPKTDFVVEPHTAVCCDKRVKTLNLVAVESEDTRKTCADLSKQKPEKTVREIKKIQTLNLAERHFVTVSDIDPKKLHRILTKTYENQPEDFEKLLGIRGVGPKTIRALSLISEIIYGTPPSYRDPARFSFAHGGKDGTPFPVDRKTYDKTIDIMKRAIHSASIGHEEKMHAIKRLMKYFD